VLSLITAESVRVLDVGAGPGLLADEFIRRGITYHAVDLSFEMLRYAQESNTDEKIHCTVGDASRLCYTDGCVETVVAMGILEYVLDPAKALQEFWRVLVPGGSAIVTVPNGFSLDRMSRHVWWLARTACKKLLGLSTDPDESIGVGAMLPHRFSARRWRTVAREAGFAISVVRLCHSRLVPYPLTKWLPHLDSWISQHTECLCGLPFAGGQLVMKLRKHHGHSEIRVRGE